MPSAPHLLNSPAAKRFDVLGLGCAAVDEVLFVPSFPAVDQKIRVEHSVRRFGGLTGAALVTAARLGARCGYAGCLGTDDASDQVAQNFEREGVNIQHAPRLTKAQVVRSTIIVGRNQGTRNIFYRNDGQIGAHDRLPSAEVIRDSKVLFIDEYGVIGNRRAARIARSGEVGIVADFEDLTVPGLKEILCLVDHLIVSEEFALRVTGKSQAARAALALWREGRAAVVVTCGKRGCYVVSAGNPSLALHYAAYQVKEADTTGCGDVFHGAYAASLAKGEPLETRIVFASAAAALKARSAAIPGLAQVERFLRDGPPSSTPPLHRARKPPNKRTVANL